VALVTVIGGLTLWGLADTATTGGIVWPRRSQTPLVGLIAGHWQSDSGATCPDGLEEVDLNLQITRRVAAIVREQGYVVQVLPEYSPRLNGYRADALLAIHNDSCVTGLSGFKVARMTHSSDPEAEDRLVQWLYHTYGAATGLAPHTNTITDDMREYHALRQIAPETPGAIIECGFMGGDRHVLTQQQDRVASGIADGLIAFLVERDAANATHR
jgi:N-acetylmuramoyl-L-alanine amidase